MFDPVFDTNTNTLTYTIMVENAASIDVPDKFGQSVVVVVDSSSNNCIEGTKHRDIADLLFVSND
ncbi:MAG TPA: hypothetical protein VE130_01810 [Nitrososphaeraceae archaeon]|nr:hypothetical protein [Nitrososphaeraceae archaeon]